MTSNVVLRRIQFRQESLCVEEDVLGMVFDVHSCGQAMHSCGNN